MKEQVILERNEYLHLKELADKTEQEILDIKNDTKAWFLRHLFDTIYTGVYDGYKEVEWGKNLAWPEEEKEWTKYLRWLKGNIERKEWDEALGCLQHAIKEIVKENREHVADKEMTNQLFHQVAENIKKFNSMPWYKKIFYRV